MPHDILPYHDNFKRKEDVNLQGTCAEYMELQHHTDMKAKHEAQRGYYTTIATKISHADKAKLVSIAEGFKMSFYELLQALLLALVRYFDAESLVTYDHNAMMNAFANTIFSLKGSFSPLSLTGHEKRNINRAILFVQQNPKQLPQLLAVSKAHDGNMKETYNFDTMLYEFLRSIDNEVLQTLCEEKASRGYFSLLQTLHDIVLERTPLHDQMADEIAEMFTDIRPTTGEHINNEVFYRRNYESGRNGESCIIPTRRKTTLA